MPMKKNQIYDKALLEGLARLKQSKRKTGPKIKGYVPNVDIPTLENQIHSAKNFRPWLNRSDNPRVAEKEQKSLDAVRKMFSGKKGDHAFNAVVKMFPSMKISGIDIVGKIEDIDSHYNLTTTGKDGKKYNIYTHVYSPEGKSSAKDRVELAAVAPGKLVEFKDDKIVNRRNPYGTVHQKEKSTEKTITQKQLDAALR